MARHNIDSTSDDSLLNIKFDGPNYDLNSVPIAELGQVLIAVQNIVNKTFLFRNERLFRGARLTNQERRDLSLQVSFRRTGSDYYGLTAFLDNPYVCGVLGGLIVEAIKAVGSYTYQKLTANDGEREGNRILVVNIYNEITSLTQRINNVGGTQSIELSATKTQDISPVVINEETKRYVRELADEKVYGNQEIIRGRVSKLFANSNVVEIKTTSMDYVKVHLTQELFEIVRYKLEPESIVEFSGRSIYHLGLQTVDTDEFQAASMKVLK